MRSNTHANTYIFDLWSRIYVVLEPAKLVQKSILYGIKDLHAALSPSCMHAQDLVKLGSSTQLNEPSLAWKIFSNVFHVTLHRRIWVDKVNWQLKRWSVGFSVDSIDHVNTYFPMLMLVKVECDQLVVCLGSSNWNYLLIKMGNCNSYLFKLHGKKMCHSLSLNFPSFILFSLMLQLLLICVKYLKTVDLVMEYLGFTWKFCFLWMSVWGFAHFKTVSSITLYIIFFKQKWKK